MKIIVKVNLPKDIEKMKDKGAETLSKIILEKFNADEINKLINNLKKSNL